MADTAVCTIDGYADLPPGRIACLVTFLEMLAPPARRPDPDEPPGLALARLGVDQIDRYLTIYRVLGERWVWFSRLVMARAELAGILDDPLVEAWAVRRDGTDCGLLELDFREKGSCEIGFFGLYDTAVGTGIGRWLMNRALASAWRDGVERVWVHTCTFDHPGAVAFYRRSGFVPCKLAIEVCDDPRLNGTMWRDAAPHVPLIG